MSLNSQIRCTSHKTHPRVNMDFVQHRPLRTTWSRQTRRYSTTAEKLLSSHSLTELPTSVLVVVSTSTLIPRTHTMQSKPSLTCLRQLKEHLGTVHHIRRSRRLLLRRQHACTTTHARRLSCGHIRSTTHHRTLLTHQLAPLRPHLLWLLRLLLLLARLPVLHVGPQIVPGAVVSTC